MTKPCRQILFLIPSLRGGGAERVIITLLRHLDRSRFSLALAVVDIRGADFLEDMPMDVELIDLGCIRVRYALPKILRLIRQRRPDVVFSTLGHLNLALAIIRPFLPDRIRYVARESSIVSETLRDYTFTGLWRWAYCRFYGRLDTVVCQSNFMRDDLVESFSLPAKKAVVIHNPVDVVRIFQLAAESIDTGYQPLPDKDQDTLIQLVAAGRLSNEKGFDLLIRALAICDNPQLRLTVLGEGPLRAELEQLTYEEGVAQQVRFIGFQKNPYPFFAQADAFVLCSRFEGFPNVVLEALACGTPVVAVPATGGVRKILEGIDDCVIAESVSSKALALAITRWIANGLSRLDDKVVVTPYLVERIVQRYEEVIIA